MKMFGRFSASDLSVLCAQIGMFLRAGLSLSDGLALLRDEPCTRRVKTAANTLANVVCECRRPLSEAMSITGMFPDYLGRMTKAGELSGELDTVMDTMAHFYAREGRLREQLRTAVFYPLLMLAALGAAVFFVLVNVLPMFQDILHELGGELPGFVTGMMWLGQRLNANRIAVLVFLLGIAALCLLMRRTKKGRLLTDRCAAWTPLSRKLAAARFAGAFGLLLRSGVAMDDALNLSCTMLRNTYMKQRVHWARLNFTDAGEVLQKAEIFPSKFSAMFAVGLKSGEADTAMERIAALYEAESNRSLERLAGSVEPVLSAVLSVLAGAILVSVILPLLGILSVIG